MSKLPEIHSWTGFILKVNLLGIDHAQVMFNQSPVRPLQGVGDDSLCFQHVRFCGLFIGGTVHNDFFKEVLKVFTKRLTKRDNGG